MLLRGRGRWEETRARAALRLHELYSPPGGADAEPDFDIEPLRPAPRFRLDRRAALAVLVVALVGALVAGAVALRARAGVENVGPADVVAAGTPLPMPGATPTAVGELVVDVQGAVRKPGVVRLPAGSRVLDALRAAGGPRRGVPTTSLNLARTLADGEQVVLASAGPAGAAGTAAGAPSGAGAAGGGPVDLNTATLEQLDALPGIGPVMAQRILDWRAAHRRFSAVEELQEIPGIGPSTFADLRDRVRV